ncbi:MULTISPECIES: hypothetical protein [unclassified Pseudoalteromonas]|uniref:hypothetical protein n=1 Tax=unclassified Pseudoalteromonas TaxID=194690 RepID=UPI001319E276|nr:MULTISPECIES: hypothetical protein [unclassified Pseudoalteromonas]
METNIQNNQPKPTTVPDKNKDKQSQNGSEIIDPVNTTVGMFDLIKEFFKAIFTK